MRELRLHSDGLRLEEAGRPVPGEGEVLVRVHAAAITRDELEWPTDRLPAVPSHELSGVVAETGDEVFALTPCDRDGVAADYAAVPAVVLAPKPARLTHVEAAALPMGGLSAWQGLLVHGRLQAGERVLITGASGGVGHLAVQLARHAGAAAAARAGAPGGLRGARAGDRLDLSARTCAGRERIYDGYPDIALDTISSRTFDARIQLLEYVPTILSGPPGANARTS